MPPPGQQGSEPCGAFTVDPAHPALPGHFPGRPIVPGVVLLDHAASLILATRPGHALRGIAAARFLQPVRPGQQVDVAYAPVPPGGTLRCTVEGRLVLEARIALHPAPAA